MRRIALILGVWAASAALGQAQPDMPAVPATDSDNTREAPVNPPESRSSPATTSSSPASTSVASAPATALRMWFQADHPSGLYYTKEQAAIDVIAELPRGVKGEVGSELAGMISFGQMVPGPDGTTFKVLSITPIADATVKPGQRVKMSVKVAFPAPGEYVLRLNADPIPGAGGTELRCIFAPRGTEPKASETSWITLLPPAATEVPGYLADYVKRTGIRRFVLDETWGPELTRDVKVLTRSQRETLLANVAEAKAALVWRLSLTAEARADGRHVTAMNHFVTAFAGQAKESLAAVCLDSGQAAPTAEELERFRAFYLSAYDAAKKQNKGVLMLGVGSVVNTDLFLVTPARGENLRRYVDVLAAEERPVDVRRALDHQALKTWTGVPVWVLPEPTAQVPAAALKAAGVAVVPVNLAERNVPAHLLGGAVLTDRLHQEFVPHIAVFQGDGYAVAAIAGVGAGTLLDVTAGATPAEGKRASLGPAAVRDLDGKVQDPCLEVADDTRSMRVVDARGNPLECRLGDTLNVPVGNALVYLLASGSAEDLTSLLRTATPRGVAVLAPALQEYTAPAAEAGGAEGNLVMRLRNIGSAEVAGEMTLATPKGEAIGEARQFVPITPGKNLEVTLPIPAGTAVAELAVEFKLRGRIQAHRLVLPKK